MEYDNILKKIGEFGPFQRKVYFILNSLSFFQCCQMFLLVFVGDKPRWHCSNVAIKQYLDKNLKYPCLKNGSSCLEITFDGEFTSVVSEWNLVCDQEYKANMGQSVMMLGCLIGVIAAGRLSDRIGRRYVTIYSQLSAFALGIATAFARSYTQFLLVRFLCGLVVVGGNLSCFVIQSEIIGPSYRGQVLTISQMFYSLGFGVFSLMAYLFRDWRQMTVIVSLPGVLYVIFFAKSIPESPRWLLAKGKISEAEVILKRIAKKNGTTFDRKLIQTKAEQQKSRSKNYGIFTLLTHKCLRLKMVVLMLIWLINSMVYYGLSFNSKNMQGDRYLNFFLSGLVEVPSYFLAVPMIDKLGRRKSLFLTVILGSIGCLVCAFGPESFAATTANVGKFGISSSFAILYVYSAELIPTAVRNFAMGTCSMAARIGGILAPFIVTLAIMDPKLPMLLFAGTGIFAGLIGLFLPETLNNPIAETLDELETSQVNQKPEIIL